MEKNDFVLIPSLSNGIYKIVDVNKDTITIIYTHNKNLVVNLNQVYRIMNIGIFKTQAV